MTAVLQPPVLSVAPARTVVLRLAAAEARRLLRHPVMVLGFAFTVILIARYLLGKEVER